MQFGFRLKNICTKISTRVFHNQVSVSSTLREDYVGLKEVADGVWDLYLYFYQIGCYDLQSNKIQCIVTELG